MKTLKKLEAKKANRELQALNLSYEYDTHQYKVKGKYMLFTLSYDAIDFAYKINLDTMDKTIKRIA